MCARACVGLMLHTQVFLRVDGSSCLSTVQLVIVTLAFIPMYLGRHAFTHYTIILHVFADDVPVPSADQIVTIQTHGDIPQRINGGEWRVCRHT